jgi:hypothetical protein
MFALGWAIILLIPHYAKHKQKFAQMRKGINSGFNDK